MKIELHKRMEVAQLHIAKEKNHKHTPTHSHLDTLSSGLFIVFELIVKREK